jgi:hypothetical protein
LLSKFILSQEIAADNYISIPDFSRKVAKLGLIANFILSRMELSVLSMACRGELPLALTLRLYFSLRALRRLGEAQRLLDKSEIGQCENDIDCLRSQKQKYEIQVGNEDRK